LRSLWVFFDLGKGWPRTRPVSFLSLRALFEMNLGPPPVRPRNLKRPVPWLFCLWGPFRAAGILWVPPNVTPPYRPLHPRPGKVAPPPVKIFSFLSPPERRRMFFPAPGGGLPATPRFFFSRPPPAYSIRSLPPTPGPSPPKCNRRQNRARPDPGGGRVFCPKTPFFP